jgi:hypothetical protein
MKAKREGERGWAVQDKTHKKSATIRKEFPQWKVSAM